MSIENFRWLASLIASHPGGEVVGRTRLQKEVHLLQGLGFPTDYPYTIHFYGPYSESLFSDIGLLEAMEVLDEKSNLTDDGRPYYVLSVQKDNGLPPVDQFSESISKLAKASLVKLELAATYHAFRELGSGHDEALMRLRRKKRSKCDNGNQEGAMKLLHSLGLCKQN